LTARAPAGRYYPGTVTDQLQEAAARAGWTSLVAVQARAIPYLLAGRNMMIQARTGSGKPGFFSSRCWPGSTRLSQPAQALILVPTRELARQVWQEPRDLQRTGCTQLLFMAGLLWRTEFRA